MNTRRLTHIVWILSLSLTVVALACSLGSGVSRPSPTVQQSRLTSTPAQKTVPVYPFATVTLRTASTATTPLLLTPTETQTLLPSPTSMPTLLAFSKIAAGYYHTCALTSNGEVLCWGDNEVGQLGDGTIINSGVPIDVTGLESGVKVIAAGGLHTCALTRNERVECWGDNEGGQLGDGTTENRSTPVEVNSLPDVVTALAAGQDYTCALTRNGNVYCWGYAWVSGNSAASQTNAPVEVSGLANEVTAISAGISHTCALERSGRVLC